MFVNIVLFSLKTLLIGFQPSSNQFYGTVPSRSVSHDWNSIDLVTFCELITSYSAQSVKSINASTNPRHLVDKADEALNILKEQMKKIKLEYDSLSANDQRRIALESEAARIKSNYLKIQEVRRTNFTKLQVPSSCSKLSSSPSLPSQFSSIQAAQNNPLPAAGRSVGASNCVGTIEQRLHLMTQDMTHRRAISDPSSIDTILNYQKSINGD